MDYRIIIYFRKYMVHEMSCYDTDETTIGSRVWADNLLKVSIFINIMVPKIHRVIRA